MDIGGRWWWFFSSCRSVRWPPNTSGKRALEAFEEAADRHRALHFTPAREWLEAGTLYVQELNGAVRFEQPVPYQQASGARKWLNYRAVEGEVSADEAKLDRFVQRACSFARGRTGVLRDKGEPCS